MSAGELVWEDAAIPGIPLNYNLYRGDVSTLGTGDYGACLEPDLETPDASVTADPSPGSAWFYLVTAANGALEGTMSLGTCAERSNFNSCLP